MRNSNREAKPARYIIKIKGYLDFHWEHWFDGMTITHTKNGVTILSGTVVDQSALHGLLEKIRNLNLLLISVQIMDYDDV